MVTTSISPSSEGSSNSSQGKFSNENVSRLGKYRPEIDGLRAFAVVAVIVNHFNKDILPGGYLGVDIFFVISGYVITSSLCGRSSKRFSEFIGGFYERRVKRILPALALNVLFVSLLICFFNASPTRDFKTGALSLVGLSNVFLAFLSTDYFGPAASLNAFTQTWSLGVEEQFYFIYPLIAWFTGFSRSGKDRLFAFFLSLLTIFSMLLFLGNTEGYGSYYLTQYRFWEIAIGCLVFLLWRQRKLFRAFNSYIPILAFVLIFFAMLLPIYRQQEMTLIVVLLTALLVYCIPRDSAVYSLLSSRPFLYIGLRSYSLYLWHWSVIVLSRFTIGIHWWTIPLQIGLTILLSELSYTFVELPFRQLKVKRLVVLVVAPVLVISLFSIIWFIIGSNYSRLYMGKSSALLANAQPAPGEYVLFSSKGVRNFFFIGDCYAGSAWWYSKDLLLENGFNVYVNPRSEGLEEPASRRGFSDRDLHPWFAKTQLTNIAGKINPGDFLGFAVNSSTNLMPPTKKALRSVIDHATSRNANVVIFGQYPSYPVVDYTFCTAEWYRPGFSINKSCNGIQDRGYAIASTLEANSYYTNLAKKHDNVYYFSQLTGLCPSPSFCLTKKSGKYLYRDGYHVTGDGAELIGREFEKFFDSIK